MGQNTDDLLNEVSILKQRVKDLEEKQKQSEQLFRLKEDHVMMLQQSEEKFKKVFNSTLEAVSITESKSGKYVEINDAFLRITGYSRNEIIGKTAHDLDIWVDRRDRENIVNELNKKGVILNFETSFRMKSNVIIPALLSARTMILNQVPVILMVTRDISQWKEALNALKESEEKFRRIFDSTLDIITITSLDTGNFIDVNQAFEVVTGYTREEVIGASTEQYSLWYDLSDKEKIQKKLKHADAVSNIQTRFKLKNGDIAYGLVSVKKMILHGAPVILMMVRNITDRMQFQKALQASEEMFRKVFTTSPDAIAITTLNEGRFVEINEGFTNLLGFTSEEVIDKTSLSLKIWAKKDDRLKMLKLLEQEKFFTGFETIMRSKSGKIQRGEISASYIDFNGKRHILTLLRSVELYKQAEERATNLNRVYHILSEINQTIVRIHDKEKLFKEVCRIVVKEGSFLMAWIGLVNKKNKRVDVVQSYGRTGDYIKNLDIRLDDPELSKGPTAQAVIREKYVSSADIATDAKMKPWQDAAAKHSYRSSIALPLKVFGKVIGVLSLYSGTRDFFNDDELSLLEKLAMDISFAMEFIEQEQEKKRAELKLRESETRYREMVENLNEMIGLHDLEGNFLAVNKATEKVTGYSRVELLTMNVKDILWDSYKPKFEVYLKEIAEKGHSSGYMSIKTKSGKRRVWEFNDSLKEGTNIVQGFALDITDRYRAEKALKEREKFYKLLFDLSPAGILLMDNTASIIDVNKAFAKNLHYEEWELIQQKLWELTPNTEKSRKIILQDIQKIKAGKLLEKEVIYQKKDGTPIYLWIRRTSIVTPQNNVLILSVSLDITEEKQMQQAISQSEERLREAQQIGKIGSWELNWRDKTLKWSEELYRIFEEDQKVQPQYSSLHSYAHPDEIKLIHATLKDSIRYKTPYKIVHRLLLKNGTVKWVTEQGKSFYDSKGTLIRTVGTIQDITAQYLADEAFRHQGEMLSAMAENYPNSIVAVLNEQKVVELISGQLMSELQVEHNKIQGYAAETILKNYKLQQFKDILIPMLHSAFKGKQVNEEVNIGAFTFDFYALPISDQVGSTNKILVIVENITKRKNIEKELKELNENLEKKVKERTAKIRQSERKLSTLLEKMKATQADLEESNKRLQHLNHELEAFSHSVSHDLKSPLRAINGFANFLKQDYFEKLDVRGQRFMDNIITNTETMTLLIDGLLRLSKTGRKQLKKVTFDPVPVIHSVFFEQKFHFNLEQAVLEMDELPQIHADYTLFKQLITNLLSNALKYSSKEKVPMVHIGYKKDNKMHTFWVRDNGVGFDPENSKKMFDSFQRLHSQKDFEGTGIGLAIVQRIVRRHGGEVWAEGTVGKGAKISFTLPVV